MKLYIRSATVESESYSWEDNGPYSMEELDAVCEDMSKDF